MQGGQIVNQIIAQLMNSGFKNVLVKVFNNVNPEKIAMKMVNAYIKKNPDAAQAWEQAKDMAFSGSEQEAINKAKNMYGERGIDIVQVVDGVIKEVKQ